MADFYAQYSVRFSYFKIVYQLRLYTINVSL